LSSDQPNGTSTFLVSSDFIKECGMAFRHLSAREQLRLRYFRREMIHNRARVPRSIRQSDGFVLWRTCCISPFAPTAKIFSQRKRNSKAVESNSNSKTTKSHTPSTFAIPTATNWRLLLTNSSKLFARVPQTL